MTLAISTAHNNARLAGTQQYADTGTANSKIHLYSGPQPASGATATGTLLATIVLTKPCGTLVGNQLVLDQDDVGGDLIVATGDAVWARWVNGDNAWVADGSVSDAAGSGDFRIAGASGTTLYAGGRVLLGTTTLG